MFLFFLEEELPVRNWQTGGQRVIEWRRGQIPLEEANRSGLTCGEGSCSCHLVLLWNYFLTLMIWPLWLFLLSCSNFLVVFFLSSGADSEFSAKVKDRETRLTSGWVAKPNGHSAGLASDSRGSYMTAIVLSSFPATTFVFATVFNVTSACVVQEVHSSEWRLFADQLSATQTVKEVHQSASGLGSVPAKRELRSQVEPENPVSQG